MDRLNTLIEYLKLTNIIIFLFILIIVLIIALVIVLTLKKNNPKFSEISKIFYIMSGVVFGSWVIILALVLMGVLPIYEEAFISSDCCAYFDDVPTLATKLVAMLPFVAITLLMIAFISRDVKYKKKKGKK